MIEYFIWGTDKKGREYPKVRGMGTCLTAEVVAYRNKYPPVVHVVMEMALPYDKNS